MTLPAPDEIFKLVEESINGSFARFVPDPPDRPVPFICNLKPFVPLLTLNTVCALPEPLEFIKSNCVSLFWSISALIKWVPTKPGPNPIREPYARRLACVVIPPVAFTATFVGAAPPIPMLPVKVPVPLVDKLPDESTVA